MEFATLKKGLMVLGALILVLIGFYATMMIGGLVVGTISNTATSGTIPVSANMTSALGSIEGDYITQSNALAGNVPLIVGLVAVVVIVLIFFGKKFNLGQGSSGGGLN